MGLHGEGIGGAIFLCLYLINFSILLFGFFTKRIRLGSVYALLLFHVVLRLAAQSVAVALGSRSTLSIGLLIAFFVLGAEGYFSLVLCSYRFLIHHHQEYYPVSGSWLEGSRRKGKKAKGGGASIWQRFRRAMTARDAEGKKDPWVMTIIHWVLIGANTIIIVGGTRVNSSDVDDDDFEQQMNIARILRAVGQSIFLTINLFLAIFLYLTVKQDRSLSGTLPYGWTRFFRVRPDHGAVDAAERDEALRRRLDPILTVLMVAWPPLVIRGIFGLLQALVDQVNYAHPDAYGSSFDGFTSTFIVCENVLSVLPEWTACCLLCATIFTRSPMASDLAGAARHEGMARLEERQNSRASKNNQV